MRRETKRLGKLCKYGHDHNGTGQSLRYMNGGCVECTRKHRTPSAHVGKGQRRSTTIFVHRLTESELALGRLLWPEHPRRPQTRAECRGGQRPCPHVRCRYHLYLDVENSGSIKLNFPDEDPTTIPETCALDIADRGGVTLDEAAAMLNLTREGLRLVEAKALARMRKRGGDRLAEYIDGRRIVRLPIVTDERAVAE